MITIDGIEYMDLRAVAVRLELSPKSVLNYMYSGRLKLRPARHIGPKLLFSPRDVEAVAAER